MNTEFDFLIQVASKNKTFRMEVTKIYEGDSLQRFRVKGGSRQIILQSNYPQICRENSRKPIDWKLLEGDISPDDPKAAAEALNKIIIAIEYRVKKDPPSTIDYIR